MGETGCLTTQIDALKLRIEVLEAEVLEADEEKEGLENSIREKDEEIVKLKDALNTIDSAMVGLI